MSLSKTANTAKLGLHVVEAGLIFQMLLISFFFCLTIRLICKLKTRLPLDKTYRSIRLQVNVVQFSLFLIAVSCYPIDHSKHRLNCSIYSTESCTVLSNLRLHKEVRNRNT